MPYSRRSLPTALVLAVLASASVARGDTVVLKNGRSIEGRVLEDTDARVVIQVSYGKLTFARDRVKAVTRGKVPDAVDNPPPVPGPEPSVEGEHGRETGEADPQRERRKRTRHRKSPEERRIASIESMRRAFRELQGIALKPWETEDSSVLKEKDARAYKIVGAGGSVRMTDDRPTRDLAGARLYAATKVDETGHMWLVDGRLQWRWVRLYWDPARGDYTRTPPGYAAFSRHANLCLRIRQAAARLLEWNGDIRCGVIQGSLGPTKGEQREKLLAELRETTAEVPGLGPTLYDLYVLGSQMRTGTAQERLARARKRAELLRVVVDAAAR